MKESRSNSDHKLFLLEDAEAFARHCDLLAEKASRELLIFSRHLDPLIYDREAVQDLLSQLARSERRARVRILIKDAQTLVERGHKLLTLARRLSSKMEVRTLLVEPQNDRHSYMIGDRDLLLYMHEEGGYQGFANYQAGPEAGRLLDEFNDLWERQSEQSVELRRLYL